MERYDEIISLYEMLYRIQRLLESHTESESSGTNHNWSDGEFAVK